MPGERHIRISIPEQRLWLLEGERCLREWPVSTARNGPGEQRDSGCTPRGRHVIRAMIGAGQPIGAVFVGRRPTGEICDEACFARQPERDWILTRILWLSGLEPGRNRFGTVDSMRRFIYIHGTPDAFPMGVPLSKGCIRMRNEAVVELFDRVSPGTLVTIRG
ncbi:L,D-transpeptidase [Natronospira bacteriovora]|uniref:L,D-transpeptidase n=1 Tax=Natronospira bacteriovora TaxID=3069753 RepID=A0ABU0W489_9GAMM|nr:L,D-transpeptidase [Natronospira sp. AB-CW4]MDQ2068275.1 L,D-transpeptidase [Natronospira sp. AB-CW4]